MIRRPRTVSAVLLSFTLLSTLLLLQNSAWADNKALFSKKPKCCSNVKQLKEESGIVWYSSDPLLSFEQLASYLGPIFAFSQDEPLLRGKKGKEIMIPEPFPFEEPAKTPIVYYRVRDILTYEHKPEGALALDPVDKNKSVINLDQIQGIDLDFFHYYTSEEGVGHHPHDVESVEFKLEILKNPDCRGCEYAIRVGKIVAKAHGIIWFDNVLFIEEDQPFEFPMTIMVEEGKHASSTDRNGDGEYSPGYDVNRRINDAWGVRDVIRTGKLVSGKYQAWMTKYRWPLYMVVPPLPKDSPLYKQYKEDLRDLTKNKAVYQLRPFPAAELAGDDKALFEKIDDKGPAEWPVLVDTGTEQLARWLKHEPFLKSIGVAYRYDGDQGIAFTIPLLIVKNVEFPLAGGWLVHRPYLKGRNLRKLGYSLLYTRSASRWVDGYLAVGGEDHINGGSASDWGFVLEGGVKFRFNLEGTFLKPITKITTPFWGVRFGIRNTGFSSVSSIGYVIEVGAGVW